MQEADVDFVFADGDTVGDDFDHLAAFFEGHAFPTSCQIPGILHRYLLAQEPHPDLSPTPALDARRPIRVLWRDEARRSLLVGPGLTALLS